MRIGCNATDNLKIYFEEINRLKIFRGIEDVDEKGIYFLPHTANS